MKEEFKAYNIPVGTKVLCRVRRCSSCHSTWGAMRGAHHGICFCEATVIIGHDGNKCLELDKDRVAELKKPKGREKFSQNVWLDDCDDNEFETIVSFVGGPLPSGAQMITDERQRQKDVEGWTPEHDDHHDKYDLAQAALCYVEIDISGQGNTRPFWPWHKKWWKPSDNPIRNLTKAGALIAAEIDRIQRQGVY